MYSACPNIAHKPQTSRLHKQHNGSLTPQASLVFTAAQLSAVAEIQASPKQRCCSCSSYRAENKAPWYKGACSEHNSDRLGSSQAAEQVRHRTRPANAWRPAVVGAQQALRELPVEAARTHCTSTSKNALCCAAVLTTPSKASYCSWCMHVCVTITCCFILLATTYKEQISCAEGHSGAIRARHYE